MECNRNLCCTMDPLSLSPTQAAAAWKNCLQIQILPSSAGFSRASGLQCCSKIDLVIKTAAVLF